MAIIKSLVGKTFFNSCSPGKLKHSNNNPEGKKCGHDQSCQLKGGQEKTLLVVVLMLVVVGEGGDGMEWGGGP